MRPPIKSNRRGIVEQAFHKMDKNNTGIVTISDLAKNYDYSKHPKYLSGEWTEKRVLQEFLETFQINGKKSDEVTKQDFVDYYAMLSAGIEKDIYFDYLIRSSFKL